MIWTKQKKRKKCILISLFINVTIPGTPGRLKHSDKYFTLKNIASVPRPKMNPKVNKNVTILEHKNVILSLIKKITKYLLDNLEY